MGDHSFLEIAARAGNVTERMRIVAALDAVGRRTPAGALSRFDTWRIDQMARRLAAKFTKESLHRAEPARHTEDDLAAVLTAYRHHELNLDLQDETAASVFADVHDAWLPVYQAALDGLPAHPPPDDTGTPGGSHASAETPRSADARDAPRLGETPGALGIRGTGTTADPQWTADLQQADSGSAADADAVPGPGPAAGPDRAADPDRTPRSARAVPASVTAGVTETPEADGSGARGRPAPEWRRFEIYYGRLAKACEPFLIELGRRLDAARARHPGRFDASLTGDLQRHLLERFELALAWAVEADAKVYCAERGIDRERASREDYLAYVDATFADAAAYHRFYLRFPVLGRWLAHVTAMLADYGSELIDRLAADTDPIGRAFFAEPVETFRSLRLGLSDHHAGARSVAFVTVTLAGGETGTFVYKPRCIKSEAAMQDLLARLRDDGVLPFATRPVLPRAGYGYEAVIPAGRNRMRTHDQVERVYAELGGHLGIFYVLGGGDLHFENILIADGHAHICDCETVLGVVPRGQARPLGTLLDSVFKTGLLEWPRTETSDTEMRISGYAGGEAYEMPIPVPQVSDQRIGFGASVTHRSGVRVRPDASNRVFLDEQLMRPQDFTGAILDGFDRVYGWFEHRPDEAVHAVTKIFTGSSVRFINWGTQVYSQLLISARHPRCLVDPLEVDLLTNTVRTFPRTWDDGGVLAERELSSMWRLDIPIFTTDALGDHLIHDHETPLPAHLDMSPIAYAERRIRRLSAGNRAQQSRYIAASLSPGEVAGADFVATSLDYATRIGERLCRMLRAPSASAPWTSYDLGPSGLTEVDVEGDLYHGSAGIALFLAYLDDLVPRTEFRRAAERAFEHAVDRTDRRRIGAFQGIGGLIYLLTHLHHLWGDPALLELAAKLSDELPPLIEDDTRFDVLGGTAGLIPVLLGLGADADGQGLDHALRCGDVLLRHGVADGDTLSWPLADPGEAAANLTGFSHGAGGIGWALIRLGRALDRPAYVEAGRRAYAYEARHFDETAKDWYDLRTNAGGIVIGGRHYANAWCNGAAGIGLSRIASWAELGGDDDSLLAEAHQALAATMRNFPRLMNDTLCHGRSGNAELFLRFGLLRDEPAFRLEANVQVQSQWRHLDEAESGITRGSAGFFPGLMIGMTGFGMHFLRLADPDRVPSVLLLDPAPSK
jgi:type 2 lantibiotic biosynthesis protein LanM